MSYIAYGLTHVMGLKSPFTLPVTFSRLEPEGKLVMGFRKASATADQVIHFQDSLRLLCMLKILSEIQNLNALRI